MPLKSSRWPQKKDLAGHIWPPCLMFDTCHKRLLQQVIDRPVDDSSDDYCTFKTVANSGLSLQFSRERTGLSGKINPLVVFPRRTLFEEINDHDNNIKVRPAL